MLWIAIIVLSLCAINGTTGGAATEEGTKQAILWRDYLHAMLRLSNVDAAYPLMQQVKQDTLRLTTADLELDRLMQRLIKGMNQRIPKDKQALYDTALKDSKWPWIGNEADECLRTPYACEHLTLLWGKLLNGDIKDAYGMIGALKKRQDVRSLNVSQVIFWVANMALYDLSTPEACAPLFPLAELEQIKLPEKLRIVEVALAILSGSQKPGDVQAACKLMNLTRSDPRCLYALVAVGYQPVREALPLLEDPNVRDELDLCIRGQKDPCDTASEARAERSARHRRMKRQFEEICKWRGGVKTLLFACPSPEGTLPLRRALGDDYEDKDQVAMEEQWFWKHVYGGQCGEAVEILKSLKRRFETMGGSILFALTRMEKTIDECRPRKIQSDLETLHLVRENRHEEARRRIKKLAGKNNREYYELMLLLQRHPRVLELSGLLSKALLYPAKFDQNLVRMRVLDRVSQKGASALPSNMSSHTAALILVLTGNCRAALERYEQDALRNGNDIIMAELMAVARICGASSTTICSKNLDRHLRLLSKQPHLSNNEAFNREMIIDLCELAKRPMKTKEADGTELIPMLGSWFDLFKHRGLSVYRFRNDPEILEGIETIAIDNVGTQDGSTKKGAEEKDKTKRGAKTLKGKRKTAVKVDKQEEKETPKGPEKIKDRPVSPKKRAAKSSDPTSGSEAAGNVPFIPQPKKSSIKKRRMSETSKKTTKTAMKRDNRASKSSKLPKSMTYPDNQEAIDQRKGSSPKKEQRSMQVEVEVEDSLDDGSRSSDTDSSEEAKHDVLPRYMTRPETGKAALHDLLFGGVPMMDIFDDQDDVLELPHLLVQGAPLGEAYFPSFSSNPTPVDVSHEESEDEARMMSERRRASSNGHGQEDSDNGDIVHSLQELGDEEYLGEEGIEEDHRSVDDHSGNGHSEVDESYDSTTQDMPMEVRSIKDEYSLDDGEDIEVINEPIDRSTWNGGSALEESALEGSALEESVLEESPQEESTFKRSFYSQDEENDGTEMLSDKDLFDREEIDVISTGGKVSGDEEASDVSEGDNDQDLRGNDEDQSDLEPTRESFEPDDAVFDSDQLDEAASTSASAPAFASASDAETETDTMEFNRETLETRRRPLNARVEDPRRSQTAPFEEFDINGIPLPKIRGR